MFIVLDYEMHVKQILKKHMLTAHSQVLNYIGTKCLLGIKKEKLGDDKTYEAFHF